MTELQDHIDRLRGLRRTVGTYSPAEQAIDVAIAVLESLAQVHHDLALADQGDCNALSALEGFEVEFDDLTFSQIKELYLDSQEIAEAHNKAVDALRQPFEAAGLEVW